MKSLFVDIATFFKTLTFIDYVLYLAILILLVLIISLIYLLKTTDIDEYEETEDEEFDIQKAVSEIENASPREIEINDYEKEQEENAIISYEELVNSTKQGKINYETDEMLGNTVSVKKFNLDNLVSEEPEPTNINVRVISYAHEEAFLEALKNLQKLLD